MNGFVSDPRIAPRNKAELRALLLAGRKTLSPEELRARGEAICQRLSALPCLQAASSLFLYFPMAGELDLRRLLLVAKERGIKVGFPVCIPNEKRLFFRQATTDACFAPGAYGIPVPPEDAPILLPDKKTVCILPALGYDQSFFRLGYGGGYYDRFLQSFPGIAVGVCLEDFLCETVFSEPHDVAADLLVTESRIIPDPAFLKKPVF